MCEMELTRLRRTGGPMRIGNRAHVPAHSLPRATLGAVGVTYNRFVTESPESAIRGQRPGCSGSVAV
jgi:hypothetical protein